MTTFQMQLISILLAITLGHSNIAFADNMTQQQALDEFLAVKIKTDFSSLQGVNLNKGGGYDIGHSKLEIGNFIANLSYEHFSVDWDEQERLPFATGEKKPLSSLTRYHLQGHIPYRLDNKRLWLAHIGAEWAYETEIKDSLSVQTYLLYSEKLNQKNSWQLGAYVNYHPVESVVLPIFEYTFNYPFLERRGYYGHVGFPKTLLGYHLNNNLRTDFGLVYHQAIVKLADNSAIEPGGFFQSKNWRASWQLHYRLLPKAEIRVGLQSSISNALVLYNQDYDKKQHFYGDGGFGWNAGVTYRF